MSFCRRLDRAIVKILPESIILVVQSTYFFFLSLYFWINHDSLSYQTFFLPGQNSGETADYFYFV